MKIWVIIPAFNEEENIVKVTREIKKLSLPTIVVDDGSSDNTYSRILEEKVNVLIRNEKNLGKGKALRKAFKYIIDRGLECDAVIIMDADAQHLPQDLDLFIDKLKLGSSFVVGNRLSSPKNMPISRIITNKIMSFIISKISGQKIPDTQCGFKAVRREVLEKFRLRTTKYDIDSELIIQASSFGCKIESIPVKSIYRKENSNINPLLDAARFIKFILSIR